MKSWQKAWSLGDTLQTRECVHNGGAHDGALQAQGTVRGSLGLGLVSRDVRIKAGEEFETG